MTNDTPEKVAVEKSLVITTIGWVLIAFFVLSFVTKIPNTLNDLTTLKNNEPHGTIIVLGVLLMVGIMAFIPIVLSVGILYRKNWCRIGIMLICLIGIGLNFYSSYVMNAFYAQQIIWTLFYFFIFMLFNSGKYKKEFINDQTPTV